MDEQTPNPKNRGLGRGLNALFDDEEDDVVSAVTNMTDEVVQQAKSTLGVDQLVPGKGQPRRVFDEDALNELSDSIRQHGILQPLLVRREEDDSADLYEIIAGERRWRAAQKAQLHEVPVIILEISDAEAFEIALIENLQREDLDPIDEALGFERLMKEHDYTQEKLAQALGKSRSYIANITRLLALPESVQQYVRDGDLSIGHARALITAENAEEIAKEVIERGLNVRETEKLMAGGDKDASNSTETGIEGASEALGQAIEKAGSTSSTPTVPKAEKGPDVLALEEEIQSRIGMRVSIDSKDGRTGTVSVSFGSLDQLDDLIWRLSTTPSPVEKVRERRLQD
mgnify:CR=1 FL=1